MATETENVLNDFKENNINPRAAKCLKETEIAFQEGKHTFKEGFLNDMEVICKQIRKQKPDKKIAYMTWELLRTNLLAQIDEYRIAAYGANWYFGETQELGTTDVSLIFQFYHQLEMQLKEDAKRYVGKISDLDVETHVRYLIPLFSKYVKELIQYAITDATELESFCNLKKDAKFQIRVGECLEPGDLIYLEDQEKNQEHILDWLKENARETYCYQDFRDMDFSGLELPMYDFRYTDFRDACLEKTNLCVSMLIGTKFRRSHLREANLNGSMLHGADFAGADLQKAQMQGTLMYDGKDRTMGRKLAGYPEGSFCGANLREAILKECIYCGVDFTGADIRETDFQDALLYRCRFTESQLEQTRFSQEQKDQIVLAQ